MVTGPSNYVCHKSPIQTHRPCDRVCHPQIFEGGIRIYHNDFSQRFMALRLDSRIIRSGLLHNSSMWGTTFPVRAALTSANENGRPRGR